jgi:hypothetical protein
MLIKPYLLQKNMTGRYKICRFLQLQKPHSLIGNFGIFPLLSLRTVLSIRAYDSTFGKPESTQGHQGGTDAWYLRHFALTEWWWKSPSRRERNETRKLTFFHVPASNNAIGSEKSNKLLG